MDGHIEKAEWGSFCNNVVKTYYGYEARLEIIGRAFGDQLEAAWLPFSGLSYDPHHNQFFITVGGISSNYPVHLTHTVDSPTKLHAKQAGNGDLSSILIVSGDKTELLIHLRRQPQLMTAR
jgi:hypothetical protein